MLTTGKPRGWFFAVRASERCSRESLWRLECQAAHGADTSISYLFKNSTTPSTSQHSRLVSFVLEQSNARASYRSSRSPFLDGYCPKARIQQGFVKSPTTALSASDSGNPSHALSRPLATLLGEQQFSTDRPVHSSRSNSSVKFQSSDTNNLFSCQTFYLMTLIFRRIPHRAQAWLIPCRISRGLTRPDKAPDPLRLERLTFNERCNPKTSWSWDDDFSETKTQAGSHAGLSNTTLNRTICHHRLNLRPSVRRG